MTTVSIGDVQVTRVEEVLGPGFDANLLLPDWTPEILNEHGSWLMPNFFHARTGKFISSIHSWVIRTGKHTILVDTCAGNHKHRPASPRFHMLDRPYLDNLRAAGVAPEEVDYVLCTHLHVDHVGWNTRLIDGRWVPTFPNAKYVFSKIDRDYFDPKGGEGGKDPNNALVFDDSVLPVIASGQAMAIDAPHNLGDQLLIEPAPGHTPGHVTIKLTSKGFEALFIGDIMHHPIQIYRPDWNSAFCVQPIEARKTRRRVLEHCASHGSLLMPAHFGRPHVGHIHEKSGQFSFAYEQST